MLAQVIVRHLCFCILMGVVMLDPALGSASDVSPCAECEQEVWEEIPCELVPNTTTAPMVKPGNSCSSYPTTEAPTTTAEPPMTTTPHSKYDKCYCECKAGCQQFCRKVMINPYSRKQITQISRSAEVMPKGVMETKHIHLRKYKATPHQSDGMESHGAYHSPPPAYTPQAPHNPYVPMDTAMDYALAPQQKFDSYQTPYAAGVEQHYAHPMAMDNSMQAGPAHVSASSYASHQPDALPGYGSMHNMPLHQHIGSYM